MKFGTIHLQFLSRSEMWGHRVDWLSRKYGPLVLDLRIDHERFGSSSDLSLNGHLHYPNDVNRSLNETVTTKIRKYHTDHNNNPPNVISFIPTTRTSGRLHRNFVSLLFLQFHRETDLFIHLQKCLLSSWNEKNMRRVSWVRVSIPLCRFKLSGKYFRNSVVIWKSDLQHLTKWIRFVLTVNRVFG
jgi:hypothetical protein